MNAKTTLSKDIEVLDNLIAKNSGVSRFPLAIETKFQKQFVSTHLFTIRLMLWISFVLFSSGGLIIYIFFPDWPAAFAINMFIGSPLILGILFISYKTRIYSYIQYILLLSALIMVICLSVIAVLAPLNFKVLVYQAMILPALMATTLGNLQFRFSLVLMLFIMVLYNISAYYSHILENQMYFIYFVGNYIALIATGFCVGSSYYSERHQRIQFLYTTLVHLKNTLLENLSHYDSLTGIANRRFFDEMLDREWRQSKRDNKPLSIIFLDFDYFKQYNDKYGHTEGDNALKQIAKVLVCFARRAGDIIARYGGDEFIILLSNTNLKEAVRIANNIQIAIKKAQIKHEGSDVASYVTTTFGVASVMPNNTLEAYDLVTMADNALTNGKKTLRNGIYIADY